MRKSSTERGNQVRNLSDPVTVTEERLFNIPLYDSMRRGRGAMILKSGNLLCMARLNFRVKCNNQLGISAIPSVVCLRKQAFFYGVRLFVWIIPIHSVVAVTGCESLKRVWLNGRRYCFGCIRSLRILNEFIVYPGAASRPQKTQREFRSVAWLMS